MFKLKQIIKIAKDYVFPIFCVGCSQEGVYLCSVCEALIDKTPVYACPGCNSGNQTGDCCGSCRSESYLDNHIGAVKYEEDKIIGRIIHRFKYDYIEDYKIVFGGLIREYISICSCRFSGIDLIAPVPLHPRRFAERGFNQAELIAQDVGKSSGIPVSSDLLKRVRYTRIQARLNKDERIKNIKDAFKINKDIDIKNKNILLVDDVFTTGSTLQECAKVLKQAGASSVRGFSVARA